MNSENDKMRRMKRIYWEAIHNYILRGGTSKELERKLGFTFYSFEEFVQKNATVLSSLPSFNVSKRRLIQILVGWKPTTLVWLKGRYQVIPESKTIKLKILPTVH